MERSNHKIAVKTSTRRRAQNSKGFTLAEVLVAMFVIVIGIAGVTSSIFWGLKHQDSGKSITEASNHGKLILERLAIEGQLLNITTWPADGSGINDSSASTRRDVYAAPFAALKDFQLGQKVVAGAGSQSNIGSDTSRFKRNITTERLTPVNSPVDDYKSNLAKVTVRIYWFENEHERHVTVQGVMPHGL